MAICKQSASSALFFFIVLTQHIMLSGRCLASPVTTINPSDTDRSSDANADVHTDSEEASRETTTAPEPPPTTQRAFTFEVYPEYQALMRKVVISGLYQQLRGGTTLPAGVSWSPTALWNSTAINKTAACYQYLKENGLMDRQRPSGGAASCAASYVCNVTENLHRFPAVLIHAECGGSESKCIDSYHTGLGFVDGSRGSCQAKNHHRVSFLVFEPHPTQEVANIQTRNATGSGVLEPKETTTKQLRGKWNWQYAEYLPLDCQCKAK